MDATSSWIIAMWIIAQICPGLIPIWLVQGVDERKRPLTWGVLLLALLFPLSVLFVKAIWWVGLLIGWLWDLLDRPVFRQ